MKKPADRSKRALVWSIRFSAAFTVLSALLLAATVADHVGILTVPAAYKPYCGPHACDYGDLVTTFLFMIFIGAALHLATRLVHYLFVSD